MPRSAIFVNASYGPPFRPSFPPHTIVKGGDKGWGMDELIGRLVANVGIDQATAQKAVGIILQFLLKEGPAEKVQELLAKLPGADILIQSVPPDEGGGGMFGGGVLAAGTRMMATGLSMGQ